MTKHWKQIAAWVICLVMIAAGVPGTAFAQTGLPAGPADFAGGSGTAEDPYIIKTEEQLDNVRNDMDSHYELADDIVITADNWQPIGSDESEAFQGVIDGRGHSITGMELDAGRLYCSGFIGYNSGQVKNIVFRDCRVKNNIDLVGDYYLGIISGFNDESASVSGCRITGAELQLTSIRGELHAGGVTGCNGGSITETSFIGTITGSHTIQAKVNIGGIAGRNTPQGLLGECYVCMELDSYQNLSVLKMSYWGGMCGYNAGTVRDGFCVGDLKVVSDMKSAGKAYLGGITGAHEAAAAMENVYQYADISGAYTKKGNVIAYGTPNNLANVYYVDSNNLTGNAGQPLQTIAMTLEKTFYEYDFESIWFLDKDEDSGYRFPQLRDLPFEGSIQQADLAGCSVSAAETMVYSGRALEPVVTVTMGDEQLKENFDYTLAYSDNVQTGTASVQLKGLGRFFGEKTVDFEIIPADISGFDVSLGQTEYTCTGKAIRPVVTIDGLTEGTDYSVTYTDNVSPGTGRVHVSGRGNYTGTASAGFIITDPQVPALSKVSGNLYSKYNTIRVSWTKIKNVTGYKVMWKKSSAGKWNSKRVTGSYATLSGLAAGTKYNVKVIPYKKVNGRFYEGKGSSVSVYTLKKVSRPAVKKYSSGKVRVSWQNISGETGYQISRSVKKNGTNIVATFKTADGKSRLVKAPKGSTCYYKVRAYRSVTVNGVTKKIFGTWSDTYKFKLK